MPEGHTIHALADRLESAFAGHPVEVTSPQGRFAADAQLLDGHPLDQASAAGKHLFLDFDDQLLHVHLGLIGSFPVRPFTSSEPPEPVGAVRLRLVGWHRVADLRGPMVCALIDSERRERIESSLGPDPLDPKAEPDRAWERIAKSRKGIGALLMEQQAIAGIGNVYRCEVLHRHRIDPFTPGKNLSAESWVEIWSDLVRLLPLGVAFGQILTMDDQVSEAERLVSDGSAASITASLTGERLGDYFERRFFTYQRAGEECLRCGGTVSKTTVAGRTLYWCPACQTRH